jgi:hypothetical protein
MNGLTHGFVGRSSGGFTTEDAESEGEPNLLNGSGLRTLDTEH